MGCFGSNHMPRCFATPVLKHKGLLQVSVRSIPPKRAGYSNNIHNPRSPMEDYSMIRQSSFDMHATCLDSPSHPFPPITESKLTHSWTKGMGNTYLADVSIPHSSALLMLKVK
jgi:hypothetical protein